jgi:regulator of sigma E protease
VKAKHLGGIITIFRGSKDHTKVGFMRGLLFLAMVSINLAILNILPIPVLDGGWLVFLIIEKIKGSPVSERTMAYFQWAGLIFVLGLMVYVTWNDVIRLIDGF